MPQFQVPLGEAIHTFEDLPKSAGIRWAVGDPDGLRSSTWRIWGNKKGDVYAAIRHLGGVTKASFHRDRKCQVGFTTEYMQSPDGGDVEGSRHWVTWKLPEAPMVQAMHIICPDEDLVRFNDEPEEARLMRWLPAPGIGHAKVTTIHIAEPPNDSGWKEATSRGELIGFFECPTRTTWITSISQHLGPNERALVATWRNWGTEVAGAKTDEAGARMLYLGGSPPAETPFMIELRPEIGS
ncbi:hypothetical protein [Variovorax sp. PBL-E5]|uniref:hypothetical protein n=1 Tax=Variovorax sp. PBL-E5 TaxID=434014 RepID=UPI0013175778|nr:hypothetical protein [Variovorax sp. PBL-E5]VTU36122.1 hypothetical protein E5CHR_04235 [Variovorax sp. PBL-E5]